MPKYSSENPSAPSMDRTKIQLETAYAPGALFTFEDFLTICESVPDEQYVSMQLSTYTEDQIFRNIEERVNAWYQNAMEHADNPQPFQCVDERLLNPDNTNINDALRISQFKFVEPERMGYVPSVLTFVCKQCRLVHTFKNISEFNKQKATAGRHTCKETGQAHQWRQLDVVFVHPNGNYEPPVPWIYDYDDGRHQVYKRFDRCGCGNYDVCLDQKSPQLTNHFYYCAHCGTPRDTKWIQNDPKWLEKFGNQPNREYADIRMKAVSYRANSVHYPVQDMVIDFGKNERLEVLSDTTNKKLIHEITKIYHFPETRINEEEFRRLVIGKHDELTWKNYKNLVDTLNSARGKNDSAEASLINILENNIAEKEDEWAQEGIVSKKIDIPYRLLGKAEQRRDLYSHHYDPFRLLIEHQALQDLILSKKLMDNGAPYYTAMDDLDQYIGPETGDDRDALNIAHRKIMGNIGIDEIGLVRKFETLQYSFGYTRVDSKPTTKYINDREVPVRLKLFEKTKIDDDRKHPIFTLKQNNEAIYVRLNEEVVRQWLIRLNTDETLTDNSIGAQYLEHVPPMTAFLDNLPYEGLSGPSMPLAIYSLLHTYAHHVMYAISLFSGLSVGSLGEYLFPADLAFIVYRRGMTMDLGNLTSMLRNNAPAFLKYLEDRANLECGSGSLCLSRGGACPDCLLIPEVSCLTQNKLLSRTLLIGKSHPGNYGFNQRIEGYLDVAQGMALGD